MKIFSFSSDKGTTLIEVMIAIILIAFVILAGGMFFVYGRVYTVREAHRRAAILVASQRLEELKASGWPPSVDGAEVLEGAPPEEVTTADNLPTPYYINTNAKYLVYSGAQDYLEVTVTVTWTDNTTNTASSTTLIARR